MEWRGILDIRQRKPAPERRIVVEIERGTLMPVIHKIALIATAGFIAALTSAPCFAQRVVALSGQIQCIGAPASVRKSDGPRSDRLILAFAERQQVRLAQSVPVNILQPGNYYLAQQNTNGNIPAGTEVNSCMLESNPATGGAAIFAYDASITFDVPVLGIVVGPSRLNNSDALLGAPGTVYPEHDQLRGLEQDGTRTGDAVSLSGDRRTVRVHFVTSGDVDEIRIVTAADGYDPPQRHLDPPAGVVVTIGPRPIREAAPRPLERRPPVQYVTRPVERPATVVHQDPIRPAANRPAHPKVVR